MARTSLATVAGRPRKRPAAPPLSDDPLVRARKTYIESRISLRELAKLFKGQPGCTFHNLAHLSSTEDWQEERERHYDRVVQESTAQLGQDEVERNVRHLRSAKNTSVTLDGVLQGIHNEVVIVLDLQKETDPKKRIPTPLLISLLKDLAAAARSVAIGQAHGIMLEQKLAVSEGSAFQKMADAADAEYQQVVARRNELVKQAEDAASALEHGRKKGAKR